MPKDNGVVFCRFFQSLIYQLYYDLQGGCSSANGFKKDFFPSHVAVHTKCTAKENTVQSLLFLMLPTTSDRQRKGATSFMKVHSTVECYFTTTIFFATPCGVS
jgi:hypothetical protein